MAAVTVPTKAAWWNIWESVSSLLAIAVVAPPEREHATLTYLLDFLVVTVTVRAGVVSADGDVLKAATYLDGPARNNNRTNKKVITAGYALVVLQRRRKLGVGRVMVVRNEEMRSKK